MRNSLPIAATAPSCAARRAGAIIVMCGVMYVAPVATTSDSLCGTAILEDLRLDHDVACTGDGLIAGVDGIMIDLNGYTLSGSGTGVGIAITGRHDVSIAGGTIRSFREIRRESISRPAASATQSKRASFATAPLGGSC